MLKTVTTTNTIDGATITEYIGPLSANVVIGANILSDILASFTDFFGGRSGTYQSKLDDLYSEALTSLRQKAEGVGADAIVGLTLDFDEISGKGKSMFMVTAVGTAVRVKYNE